MRIIDLVAPYRASVARVVDRTPEAFDLPGQLQLDVRWARSVQGPFADGDLVVDVWRGPDDVAPRPEAESVLRELAPGARVLLLDGAEGRTFAFGRLLELTVANRLQVRQVAGFERAWPRTGVVLERVEHPAPAGPYHGGEVVRAENADDAWLRLANEYVLADYVARGVRSAWIAIEAQEEDRRAREGRERLAHEKLGEVQRRSGELSAALADAQREVNRLQRKLRQAETSTSMRLGSTLVKAARSPRRGAPRLPRELYRMWRYRSSQRSDQAPSPAAAPGEPPSGRLDHHFLGGRVFVPQRGRRPVVAGLLTDRVAELLAPTCDVVQLFPNDAVPTLERVTPDLLLVEVGVARPGGPWAHLGSPYAAERTRELLAVLDAVHAADRPAVMWRDIPHAEAPGLVRLGERFDLLCHGDGGDVGGFTWSPGVQLARFNPLGEAARDGVVDAAGHVAPSVLRAAVVRVVEAGSQTRLPDEAAEALACGAGVVLIGDPALSATLPEPLRDAVRVVRGREDVDAAVDELRTAAEEPATRRRERLRALHEAYSVPVRLSQLGSVLDVPPVGGADRGVTVLAASAGDADVHRLVGQVLEQTARPAAVRMDTGVAERHPALVAELGEGGVTVLGTDAPAFRDPSPWWALWEPGSSWSADHLGDLLLAAEVTGADAVGLRMGQDLRFVDALDWQDSLVSTSGVRRWGGPASGSLGDWWRAGGRLVALAPGAANEDGRSQA